MEGLGLMLTPDETAWLNLEEWVSRSKEPRRMRVIRFAESVHPCFFGAEFAMIGRKQTIIAESERGCKVTRSPFIQ